ncbi:MAG: sulfotransferase domain-containing protein [Proteobacteria bacterium]|nr:sulfotransferase domain-containing protein [Pseudomonadota bacterium]MBU1060710.1 sulfotransferase domain-containing protein [Pseudomonadota bacterium]
MIPNSRPTFLGIGAQRAGTSWLYSQLLKHPKIYMPPVKEIHFFDRSEDYPSPNDLTTSSCLSRIMGSNPWQRPRMIAGIKTISRHIMKGNLLQAIWWSKWILGYYDETWYCGLFSQPPMDMICGEITPSYSILKSQDVARIKAVNSEMKCIYIIRNPIERAWSAIRFHAHSGVTINLDSAEEIIAVLKHPGMLLRNDYERTIDTYLKHFDRSQILLCFYDAIKCDPLGLMASITNFLAIQPFNDSLIDSKVLVNPSPKHSMPINVQDYLLETYSPMINRIAQTLGSYARTWSSTETNSTPLSPEKNSPHLPPPALHPS